MKTWLSAAPCKFGNWCPLWWKRSDWTLQGNIVNARHLHLKAVVKRFSQNCLFQTELNLCSSYIYFPPTALLRKSLGGELLLEVCVCDRNAWKHLEGSEKFRQIRPDSSDSFLLTQQTHNTQKLRRHLGRTSSMEIKSVTLEKSCENMPWQSCFEKPRSCWYDCLCVCGHGIMISLVIVKCDLHSSALCESRLILPQSATPKTAEFHLLHTSRGDRELPAAALVPASEK